MEQKVIRAGNSRAVVVPARFAKMVGVKCGDMVKVRDYPETGKVVYTFSGVHQLKLPRTK